MAQLPDWRARAKAHEAEIERRRETAAEIAPDRVEPIPTEIQPETQKEAVPNWGPLPLKMTKEEIEAKRRRDAEAMKRWGRLVTRTRTRRVYRIDK